MEGLLPALVTATTDTASTRFSRCHPTWIRRQWLNGLIRELRTVSRKTDGLGVRMRRSRGMGIVVRESLVGAHRRRRPAWFGEDQWVKGVATADDLDLVPRQFYLHGQISCGTMLLPESTRRRCTAAWYRHVPLEGPWCVDRLLPRVDAGFECLGMWRSRIGHRPQGDCACRLWCSVHVLCIASKTRSAASVPRSAPPATGRDAACLGDRVARAINPPTCGAGWVVNEVELLF